MSEPNASHACFLPGDCFKRLKQYQADYERGIEDREVGGVADENQGPESEREGEGATS